MKFKRHHTLPPKQERAKRKAIRIEWITLAFLLSDVILLYITMGQSQAMKTAWIDDALSMTPPLVFLVSERVRIRNPTERFPYGFHRVVSVAFVIASSALFFMGAYLLYESVGKLLSAHHPSIGTMSIFGQTLWAGWPMVAAAAWSGISAAILGRLKLPLGPILHNKILHADATMNKADWLVSGAAITGVLGIGLGWWWADAVAAAIISTDILWDGFKHLRSGFADLLDRVPETVDTQKEEPTVMRIKCYFETLPWVKDSIVRIHEEGHLFFGEAFVLVSDDRALPGKIEATLKELAAMDWRIRDFTITPVEELPKDDGMVA